MRIGMWMGAPLRALGMAAAMALAACGGGSGDDKPALDVTVQVDGVADSAGPLSAGETSTIEVASGATLVFDSPGETRWEPTTTDSTFAVNSFSFTSKSMTVSSNAGGTLVVVFTNKADASEKATLNVTVAPKEFQHVDRVDGELEGWVQTTTDAAGVVTRQDVYNRTLLMGEGNYGVESGLTPDFESGNRALYDAQDRNLGYVNAVTGIECRYDTPITVVSYPLHVGASWSGDGKRVCGLTTNQHYARSVEAYERVVVPQGSHDALRIQAEVTYRYSQEGLPDSGFTVNSTCWWAIDLGRNVKCDYVYHYDNGSSDSRSDVMTSLTR
jgi:hypothetical protein